MSNLKDNQKKATKLKFNKTPNGRRDFALCNNNEFVYIFGGVGITNRLLNDLWEINGKLYENYIYLFII